MKRPLWVFGYGSLIWRPDFAFAAREQALLRGLHRDLCVISHVHRGTPDRPGLVAGLDLGGACRGVAFQVVPGAEQDTIDYLRAREQQTMVYRETSRRVQLADGRHVEAVCFVVDRGHHQYGKGLSLEEKAALLSTGVGKSGRSIDYLTDLIDSLERLGITDTGLLRLRDAASRHGREGDTSRVAADAAPLSA